MFPGRHAGSHWFHGVLVAVLLSLLSYTLLGALQDAQEMSEKLLVESTLRNMRTGLQLATGDAMMHGRENEIAHWVGANPVRWLGRLPAGYEGDCTTTSGKMLAAGRWCFDADSRELVYAPRNAKHLRIAGTDGESKQLRWRVSAKLKAPEPGGLLGLSVENVTPYAWQLDYH